MLKQFLGSDMQSFLSEIKIFTEIERRRHEQSGGELKQVINNGKNLTALPLMLAYKTNKSYAEVLMTHGGSSLDQWINYVKQKSMKVNFAAEMLR